jgi:hypothetical protein
VNNPATPSRRKITRNASAAADLRTHGFRRSAHFTSTL